MSKKRIGPPVWAREHAEKFKAKYEGAENVFGGYIEGGKYVFEIRRKYLRQKASLKISF